MLNTTLLDSGRKYFEIFTHKHEISLLYIHHKTGHYFGPGQSSIIAFKNLKWNCMNYADINTVNKTFFVRMNDSHQNIQLINLMSNKMSSTARSDVIHNCLNINLIFATL